jgi:hypothetical protein
MTTRLLGCFFALLASTPFGLFAGCNGATVIDSSAGALRAAGSACAFDSQCESRMCNAPADGGCGVCVDVRALGEPCDGPHEGCSRSATCTAGVCKSNKKTLGEPCMLGVKGDPRECDDELYCAPHDPPNGDGGMGTCAPRGVLGGACDVIVGCAFGADCERGLCVVARVGQEGDSCDQRRCAEGLFCAEGGTCRAATLPIGADCGAVIGQDTCALGGACELTGGPPQNGLYPMACVAGRKEGELCASSHCEEGLFCAAPEGKGDYVCKRRLPAGQPCHGDECAAGLECRAGVCAEACR